MNTAQNHKMRVLAVIPARAGSKGIPGKNIKIIAGQPLLAYSALAATQSENIDRVILSTDSADIAEVGSKYGLDCNGLRPSELSDDHSSTLSVIKYELGIEEKEYGRIYDLVLLLQPTCPMRTTSLIDKAIAISDNEPDYDSYITVVNVDGVHPYRMYSLDNNTMVSFVAGDHDPMLSRQYLPEVFIRSGDIYLTWVNTIEKFDSLIGKNPRGIEVEAKDTVNVDSEYDWIVAESKLQKL